MSFQHNQKLWIATTEDLRNAFLREKVLRSMKPMTDRVEVHRFCGDLYARYVVLCNNLGELYDQTLQTPKRDVIENLLVTATHRLQELKLNMQKIEMSEFVCVDDALIEMKLTPQNIEFLCPFYFPRKRDIETQRIVDEIPKSPTPSEVLLKKQQLTGLDKYRKVLTPEEIAAENLKKLKNNAASLIKSHEKARQARVLWFNLKNNPKQFHPKPKPFPEVAYEFYHKADQVPLVKIKRTHFKFDLNRRAKVVDKNFKFYEPPKFIENEYGQKVRAKEKSVVFRDEVIYNGQEVDEEDLETVRQLELQREKKLAQEQIRLELEVKSAIKIQRAYHLYKFRKMLKVRRRKRLEICGLVHKIENPEIPSQISIAEQNRLKRRERKRKFDDKIVEILNDEKSRIIKSRGTFIMEDITDHIRAWFREFYDGAQDFHRYPEEFEGGTILVLTGETMTVEEFLKEKSKSDEQKKKEKQEKKKQKKREEKEKKKEMEREKKAEEQRLALERKQGPTWDFRDEKRFDTKHFSKFCIENFNFNFLLETKIASSFNQSNLRNCTLTLKINGSSLKRIETNLQFMIGLPLMPSLMFTSNCDLLLMTSCVSNWNYYEWLWLEINKRRYVYI